MITCNEMSSNNTQQFQPEPHRVHRTQSFCRQPEPSSVHQYSFTAKANPEIVSNVSKSRPGYEHQSSITDRNHVTISIRNRTFSALLDTGASRSVCSIHVAKQLKYSIKPLKSDEILSGANGSLLKVLGTVVLPIKIEDIILHHSFYVVDRVVDDIVLGVDFMEIVGAKN